NAVPNVAWPPVRLVRIVTPASITRLPLAIVFGYVVATFGLFSAWPIDWPIYTFGKWLELVGYVALCLAVVGAAAYRGSAGPTRVTAPLPYLPALLPIGACAAALLLIPASLVYTGMHPWELLDALKDQGAAYRRLQQQLLITSGERNNIVAL